MSCSAGEDDPAHTGAPHRSVDRVVERSDVDVDWVAVVHVVQAVHYGQGAGRGDSPPQQNRRLVEKTTSKLYKYSGMLSFILKCTQLSFIL